MNVRFFAGTKAEYLGLAKHNPIALYFCRDTRELFWGNKLISDGMRVVSTSADLPAFNEAADGIIYYVVETKNGYVLSPNRMEWIQVIYAPANGKEIDLSDYYTKSEVDAAIASIKLPDWSGFLTEIPEEYVTEEELAEAIAALELPAVDLTSYATKDFVEELVKAIEYPNVDLTDYVKREELNNFITEIPEYYITEEELEAKGYLTEIPDVNLDGIATEEFVLSEIAKAELNDKDVDLGAYYTKTEVEALIPDVSNFATKEEIPFIDDLASVEYVDNKFDSIKIPEVDLSEYATKDDIPSIDGLASENFVRSEIAKIVIPDVSNFITEIPKEYVTDSELESKGYITEHQSLAGYATETFVKNAIAEAELSDKDIDLSGLATKDDIKNFASVSYVDEKVAGIDLSDYATKEEIPNLDGYAKQSDIPSVDSFATKVEVANAIAAIEHPVVDLSSYATKEEIKGLLSEIPEEYVTESELEGKGYLTQHQSLDDYAKKSELFNKDYNDLLNKPEIPSIAGLATEQYVTDAISKIPDVDLSNYATKSDLPNLEEYAKKSDIPSVADFATKDELANAIEAIEHPTVDLTDYVTKDAIKDFISEIPAEYVTEDELDAKGYLTEHQSLAGYATEQYVLDTVNELDIPEINLQNYYTKAETSKAIVDAIADKADDVPFNTDFIVVNAIGAFAAGESVKGLTVAQIFAKLLGLKEQPGESTDPDEPEEEQKSAVDRIMTDELSMYQIVSDGQLEETEYLYKTMSQTEALAAPETTCFYQIIDNGVVLESGYQQLTSYENELLYMIALPDFIQINSDTMKVSMKIWDNGAREWKTLSGFAEQLTCDLDLINTTCDEYGLLVPETPAGYTLWANLDEVNNGEKYRFVIEEVNN